MAFELRIFNYGKAKAVFEVEHARRPWDIFLMISAGSFSLAFPETSETRIVGPNEIARIPPNREFIRRVESPIDFYQIAALATEEDELYRALPEGKLPIPKQRVEFFIESLRGVSALHGGDMLSLRILEHILVDNLVFSAERGRGRAAPDREIERVTEYMKEHLGEKIDIDTLAKEAYLSHTGLIWKFKRELGVAPSEYLIALRMSYAKELLLESDAPIAKIAEKCGYANAYYFSNAFHKREGISPLAFRKNALD